MIRFGYTVAAIAVFGTCGASAINAQENPDVMRQAMEQRLQSFDIDLAVPDTPAFAILGLSPDNIVRPTTPKELALGLLNGSDRNGTLQTGIAIDTVPYLLFTGDALSLAAYRDSIPTRLLANTQLSLATAKASDDSEAVRLAVGLRVTPWNLGDPRMGEVTEVNGVVDTKTSLLGCLVGNLRGEYDTYADALEVQGFNEALIASLESGAQPPSDGRTKEQEIAELRKEIEAMSSSVEGYSAIQATTVTTCREEARKRDWNASSLTFGVAPVWTSEDGDVGELDYTGVGIYGTLGYGFEGIEGLEDSAQLLAHGRLLTNQMVPSAADESILVDEDNWSLGAQIRVAGPTMAERDVDGGPDLSFLAEAMFTSADRQGVGRDDFMTYSVGAEYQVADGSYIKLTLGTEDGRDEGGDNSFVIGAFTIDFSDVPTPDFTPPGLGGE